MATVQAKNSKELGETKTSASQTDYMKRTKQLICGAIAGGIARTVTSPFERTIILQQTQNQHYSGIPFYQVIFKMLKEEGPLSMFKGNGTNVSRIMPFSAIELCTFEIYKPLLAKTLNIDSKSSWLYLGAGAMSGMTATFFTYPLDLARTLLAFQTDTKDAKNMRGFLKEIVREKGFTGLFRGMGATLIGITPYASLKLTFFQIFKNLLSKDGKSLSVSESLTAGAFAGCLAVSVTYPTDLIRRKIQIEVLKNNVENYGYYKAIKEVYRTKGMKGFYVGLPATYMKLFPSTAITFMINEWLKTEWNCH